MPRLRHTRLLESIEQSLVLLRVFLFHLDFISDDLIGSDLEIPLFDWIPFFCTFERLDHVKSLFVKLIQVLHLCFLSLESGQLLQTASFIDFSVLTHSHGRVDHSVGLGLYISPRRG